LKRLQGSIGIHSEGGNNPVRLLVVHGPGSKPGLVATSKKAARLIESKDIREATSGSPGSGGMRPGKHN
jgi:hypothetical protein